MTHPNKSHQRRKVWVSEAQLKTIAAAVANKLDHNRSDQTLRGLHDEIAVAKDRYEASTAHPRALSHALGRQANDVPLSLSIEEVAILITSPGVSEELRNVLLAAV